MKFYYSVVSLATLIAQASGTCNSSSPSEFCDWYRCAAITFPTNESSNTYAAECAVFSAVLCHPGICETPDSVNSRIDVFIKRIPAVNNPETALNVWLMAGGPGFGSTSMELSMVQLHSQLSGSANVYTMDYRGTGRSTLLDCVAAQGSFASSKDPSRVPSCAQELKQKYGSLSSFSIISAATDLATAITNYTNGRNTIVYAEGYGTRILKRLMSFSLAEVIGYCFDDGIMAFDITQNFSRWDTTFGAASDAFLDLCATTSDCNKRFMSKSLRDSLQDLITYFDSNPDSPCAALVSNGQRFTPASHILRRIFGNMIQENTVRLLIPPLVHRMTRCEPKDIDVLKHFLKHLNLYVTRPRKSSKYRSNLLYYVIVFSELWEKPTPSIEELTLRFKSVLITNGEMQQFVPLYCAFSKEKSSGCNQFNVGNYLSDAITYNLNDYGSEKATIPAHASVLWLQSKLKMSLPRNSAEALLEQLDGAKKELIAFEYAAGAVLRTTPYGEGKVTCGMNLLSSYVANNGDLQRLDKSCVGKMPPFRITPVLDEQYYFLSTEDAFDGVYVQSLSANVSIF